MMAALLNDRLLKATKLITINLLSTKNNRCYFRFRIRAVEKEHMLLELKSQKLIHDDFMIYRKKIGRNEIKSTRFFSMKYFSNQ